MQFTRTQSVVETAILDRIVVFIGTGGYCGYSPLVPGTVGSLVGLVIYLPLMTSSQGIRWLVVAVLFSIGVLAGNRIEDLWRIKDPKPVVIDEIVGMWLALLFVPHQFLFFIGAFVLFRLFDIVKPFPARQAESLPGGWGIMLDDVIAGAYAGILLYGLVILGHALL